MTKETAARILDPETSLYELCRYEADNRLEACNEACRMGAAALREQKERENPKQLTNADRIRAMSDEEMAKFLCELRSSESYGFPCSYCVAEEFCHDGHTGMIDWLQQPLEEADHETG